MKEIIFYKTFNNFCPIEEFFDSLSDKQVEKVLWVIKIIKEFERVPKQYFKKLINTNDIWEIRVQLSKSSFRFLGFIYKSKAIILTNAFSKKSQKTPKSEILLAEKRKQEYIKRNK